MQGTPTPITTSAGSSSISATTVKKEDQQYRLINEDKLLLLQMVQADSPYEMGCKMVTPRWMEIAAAINPKCNWTTARDRCKRLIEDEQQRHIVARTSTGRSQDEATPPTDLENSAGIVTARDPGTGPKNEGINPSGVVTF